MAWVSRLWNEHKIWFFVLLPIVLIIVFSNGLSNLFKSIAGSLLKGSKLKDLEMSDEAAKFNEEADKLRDEANQPNDSSNIDKDWHKKE